eukprot:2279123-Amphidinium_carterae.2
MLAENIKMLGIKYIMDSDILPSGWASAADAQSCIDDLHRIVLDCQVLDTTGLQINREMWEQKLCTHRGVEDCW